MESAQLDVQSIAQTTVDEGGGEGTTLTTASGQKRTSRYFNGKRACVTTATCLSVVVTVAHLSGVQNATPNSP